MSFFQFWLNYALQKEGRWTQKSLKSYHFWATKMSKLKVSEYRSIGAISIGDTDTKNRADTTDTSIPIENANPKQVNVIS